MFNRPFSTQAIKQANSTNLHSVLAEKRRAVRGVTVDGPLTRDFDDAIWVEPRAGGGYTVTVSIADVSSLVPKDSPMDVDGRQRATSLYRAHGVSPMLPGILSDNLMSLREGEPRPTITVTMELNDKLDVTDVKLEKTQLASEKRYTYDQATQLMADREHPMHQWGVLANGLLEKRRKAGALAFYDAKSGIYVSGDTAAQQLKAQSAPAHILVQELMILTNSVVAKTMAEAGMPFPYRNHRAASLSETGEEVVHKLEDFAARGELDLARLNGLTHMYKRATYDARPEGHVGLRLPYYTHFTSPIRRYPDLIGHRIVKAYIDGEPSPYSQAELDKILPVVTERINAEREEKDDALRQRRYDKAANRGLYCSAERVMELPPGDFSTMVKVAAESGEIGDRAADGIARRIRARQFKLVDLVQIMTVSPQESSLWDWLRQEALEHIKRNPLDAVTMLQDANALHKERWRHKLHSRIIGGTMHLPVFASYVEATIDGQAVSNAVAVRGTARKETQQKAAIAFWEDYLAGALVPASEVSVPEERAPQAPAPKTYKNPPSPPPPSTESPMVLWDKIVKKHRYEQDWAFEPAGGDVPGWEAALRLSGKDVPNLQPIRGYGGSKSAAKLDAVKQALANDKLPHNNSTAPEAEAAVNGNGQNPVGKLHELATARGWTIEWDYKKEGAAHTPLWTANLVISGPGISEPIPIEASALDKKQAERNAASLMLMQPEVAQPQAQTYRAPAIPVQIQAAADEAATDETLSPPAELFATKVQRRRRRQQTEKYDRDEGRT